MKNDLSIVYLARHGETAWSLSGRHTGLTDLPLTEQGERTARRLVERLQGLTFAKVFTSPLQRARQTCALAGFGPVAEIDPDLVEWDYGKYEGRRGAEIRAERPDWNLFRDGCPGGETPQQVSARADHVVSRVRAIRGDVLVFTSGHFMRVLASRWLGLEPTANSRYFMLSTASLSAAPKASGTSASPVPRLIKFSGERRGWTVAGEYVDAGFRDRLMLDAHKRRFDVVAVWKFDRFARYVSHLLRALDTFRVLGIEFVSLSESLDTATPAGRMVFTVLGAVAELERSLIAERVRAGLRNARAKGKRLGRPKSVVDASRVAALRSQGLGWKKIAAELGMGVGTLYRLSLDGSKTRERVI